MPFLTSRLSPLGILLCGLACLLGCEKNNNQAAQLGITGKVVLSNQNTVLPADSRLHIILEDVSRTDIAAQTLAELEQDAIPPLHFNLAIEPALVTADRRYNLRAKIVSTKGALLWISNTSQPLPKPGHAIVMEVVQTGGNLAAYQTYQCEALRLVASVSDNTADLSIEGKSFTLDKVESASGAHYQSAQADFWSKGDDAMFALAGEPRVQCVLLKATQS